jgi:hypothetical protein
MLGGAFLSATHASSRPFSSSALLAVAVLGALASQRVRSAVLKGAKRLADVRGAAPALGAWRCSCCMVAGRDRVVSLASFVWSAGHATRAARGSRSSALEVQRWRTGGWGGKMRNIWFESPPRRAAPFARALAPLTRGSAAPALQRTPRTTARRCYWLMQASSSAATQRSNSPAGWQRGLCRPTWECLRAGAGLRPVAHAATTVGLLPRQPPGPCPPIHEHSCTPTPGRALGLPRPEDAIEGTMWT